MRPSGTRETVDERLARLRHGTGALAPPPGLAARIARDAQRSRWGAPPYSLSARGLSGVVLPFGRSAMVVAALAAAAAVTLAIRADRHVDEAMSNADGVYWEP